VIGITFRVFLFSVGVEITKVMCRAAEGPPRRAPRLRVTKRPGRARSLAPVKAGTELQALNARNYRGKSAIELYNHAP
jgi:hypothetical protein